MKTPRYKVITDNTVERIQIGWDYERFVLLQMAKSNPDWEAKNIIILNPKEAKEMADFIREVKDAEIQ